MSEPFNVLLTGASRLHANDTAGLKTRYQSTPGAVRQALEKAGHNVDHRPVRPGENLDRYDALIVGIMPIDKAPSQHAFGMLWAIAHDKPKCFLLDDWKRGLTEQPFTGKEKSLFRSALGRSYRAEAKRVWPEILEPVAQHFKLPQSRTSRRWKVPTIGTFFDWGNLDLFRRFNAIGELRGFMPSPFIPNYAIDPQDQRQHAWVRATLAPHDDWIGRMRLGWPIEHYGKNAPTQPNEEVVVQAYAKSWGVLCPRYPHAGSGWYRCRFEYAARAGAILLSSPDEVGPLGETYTIVGEDPREVEKLGDDDLRDLAKAQRMALQPHLWSEDRLVTWMDELVQELVMFGKSDTPIDQNVLRAARFDDEAEAEEDEQLETLRKKITGFCKGRRERQGIVLSVDDVLDIMGKEHIDPIGIVMHSRGEADAGSGDWRRLFGAIERLEKAARRDYPKESYPLLQWRWGTLVPVL